MERHGHLTMYVWLFETLLHSFFFPWTVFTGSTYSLYQIHDSCITHCIIMFLGTVSVLFYIFEVMHRLSLYGPILLITRATSERVDVAIVSFCFPSTRISIIIYSANYTLPSVITCFVVVKKLIHFSR